MFFFLVEMFYSSEKLIYGWARFFFVEYSHSLASLSRIVWYDIHSFKTATSYWNISVILCRALVKKSNFLAKIVYCPSHFVKTFLIEWLQPITRYHTFPSSSLRTDCSPVCQQHWLGKPLRVIDKAVRKGQLLPSLFLFNVPNQTRGSSLTGFSVNGVKYFFVLLSLYHVVYSVSLCNSKKGGGVVPTKKVIMLEQYLEL